TDFDQANVTGSVTINGAVLSASGGTTVPTTPKVLTIIRNDGTDPVTVTNPFVTPAPGSVALPEGSLVTVGTFAMALSYQGGDGNDVTLSVAPAAITSANATTFITGTANSFTVTTTGAPAPALTETGTLPAGVS